MDWTAKRVQEIITALIVIRFAYVEFMDKSSIANAVELNESIFKGRPLKVCYNFLSRLCEGYPKAYQYTEFYVERQRCCWCQRR